MKFRFTRTDLIPNKSVETEGETWFKCRALASTVLHGSITAYECERTDPEPHKSMIARHKGM
jgi:hypothetical protein